MSIRFLKTKSYLERVTIRCLKLKYEEINTLQFLTSQEVRRLASELKHLVDTAICLPWAIAPLLADLALLIFFPYEGVKLSEDEGLTLSHRGVSHDWSKPSSNFILFVSHRFRDGHLAPFWSLAEKGNLPRASGKDCPSCKQRKDGQKNLLCFFFKLILNIMLACFTTEHLKMVHPSYGQEKNLYSAFILKVCLFCKVIWVKR